MSRRLLCRSVLIGLLAGPSIVATAAGCGGDASNPGAGATATSTRSAEPLAPQLVAQVQRLRTATVKVGLEVGGSGGRAELSGQVEYSADGVHADLAGTIEGNPVHLIVLGETVYVSQLFNLPAGAWLKMAAGGERTWLTTRRRPRPWTESPYGSPCGP